MRMNYDIDSNRELFTSRTSCTFIFDWWQLFVSPRFIEWMYRNNAVKTAYALEVCVCVSVCVRGRFQACEHDNCVECIDVRTWYHDLYDDTEHAYILFCSLEAPPFFRCHFRDLVVSILNVFACHRMWKNPLSIAPYYIYQMSNHWVLCQDNMYHSLF